MDDVIAYAHELADKIKHCESMRQYEAAKACVAADEALMLKIKEFKKIQIAFEWKKMQGEPPDFNEERYLSKLYTDLMLDDDAKAFLAAERAVLTMIEKLHQTIHTACQIDVDF